MKTFLVAISLVWLGAHPATAQQVPDTDFRFANPKPAYEKDAGPRVCVDEAHHNFHTAGGRYLAFAELLHGDGYRVRGSAEAFAAKMLAECDLVVIANPQAERNVTDRALPHPSAFAKEELTALMAWIRDGGSLLLIVDHPPYAGAASDLGALLGVALFPGYAGSSMEAPTSMMVFGTLDEELVKKSAEALGAPPARFRQLLGDPGKLGTHAILNGRNAGERILSVATFTGTAFHPSTRVAPLLILSPKAGGMVPVSQNLPNAKEQDYPFFSLAGWLQGGTLRLGQGRVVILGEAAMCTAQRAGPQRVPMGMNVPLASQNAQFCLNAVRWLSGLLKEEPQ